VAEEMAAGGAAAMAAPTGAITPPGPRPRFSDYMRRGEKPNIAAFKKGAKTALHGYQAAERAKRDHKAAKDEAKQEYERDVEGWKMDLELWKTRDKDPKDAGVPVISRLDPMITGSWHRRDDDAKAHYIEMAEKLGMTKDGAVDHYHRRWRWKQAQSKQAVRAGAARSKEEKIKDITQAVALLRGTGREGDALADKLMSTLGQFGLGKVDAEGASAEVRKRQENKAKYARVLKEIGRIEAAIKTATAEAERQTRLASDLKRRGKHMLTEGRKADLKKAEALAETARGRARQLREKKKKLDAEYSRVRADLDEDARMEVDIELTAEGGAAAAAPPPNPGESKQDYASRLLFQVKLLPKQAGAAVKQHYPAP